MTRGYRFFFKALFSVFMVSLLIVLLNSAFDIYNDFVYDRAILKDNPYGYTPLLKNVNDYSGTSRMIKGGEYVYVEEWLSAHDGRVAFAKVRSKFDWGYINREMLVETNINVIPVISTLVLIMLTFLFVRNLVKKNNT